MNIKEKIIYGLLSFIQITQMIAYIQKNFLLKYHLNIVLSHLILQKIDIDENEELGKKYGVNTHRYQNIIPYIILFVNGKDTERFPGTDKNGNPWRVKYYREKEIVRIFDLEELKRKTSK